MTITALSTPPVPANSDMDRAMTVWINGSAGNSNDPIKNDSAIQSLINFCGNNGVNVVCLDFYPYLGSSNWSAANAAQVARAIHYLHASGIKVYAMAGNNDWGHNQQWVASHVLKAIQQYQAYCDTASVESGYFDGVIFDAEYWTVTGYTSTEPTGLCDLMWAARRALGIPVGCFATQWLADPNSAALVFTYNGVSQIEGKHLMDNADFVWVMCIANTASGQESMFDNWYSYASATGVARNKGLWIGCETTSGISGTYWTGSAGAKSAMETQLTSIASNYKPAAGTNMSYLGAGINAYYVPGTPSGWSQMS